jgi:tetrahydromethanopterin S-methyltransferase subunit C
VYIVVCMVVCIVVCIVVYIVVCIVVCIQRQQELKDTFESAINEILMLLHFVLLHLSTVRHNFNIILIPSHYCSRLIE